MARTWTLKQNGSTLGTTVLDGFEPVVLATDVRLGRSLTLRERIRHYTPTLDLGDVVAFEDPVGTSRFVGVLDSVSHSSSEEIVYECVGHRQLAEHVQVRRGGPDEAVQIDFPRRVYNAATEDEDAAYNAGASNALEVGEILQDLFDSFLTDLRDEGACAAAATPYDTGELAGLSFVPAKLVFDRIDFSQAVDLLLAEQGPTWACEVGVDGVWHFFDRMASSANTITLDDDPVAENLLRRDLRKRFTAVRIFGRRGQGLDVYPHVVGIGEDESGSTLSGLEEAWDPGDESNWTRKEAAGRTERTIFTSQTSTTITVTGKTWDVNAFAGGYAIFPYDSWTARYTIASNTADTITFSGTIPTVSNKRVVVEYGGLGDIGDVFRKFRITDADKRDVVLESTGDVDCCPHVQVIHRNSLGDIQRIQKVSIRLEGDGYVRTDQPLYTSPSNGQTAGDSTLWPDFKLVYCYRDSSTESLLSARYPTSGYSGDAAAAPFSVQRELRVIEEEFRSQEDAATYALVAEEVHKLSSRVLARGRISLQGIDYSRFSLQQRIHLDHTTDTTGWEALGAPPTVVSISYGKGAGTTLDLGDDGSTLDLDLRGIRDRILSARNAASGAASAKHMGDWVNCQDSFIGAGATDSELTSSSGSEKDTLSVDEPGYRFPRSGADKSVAACRCDASTNPCALTQQESAARSQFICMPDDQHGLVIRNPADTFSYCWWSHLLRYDNWETPFAPTGYKGMYYPILCKGKDFTDEFIPPVWNKFGPTGVAGGGFQEGFCWEGSTNHGMRDLVVVEPTDKDADNEVSTGELLLEFLAAYDGYMQRNEEAHCCLDNRLSCSDRAIFGDQGPGCANGGPGCTTGVIDYLGQLAAQIHGLSVCCSAIKQGTGKPLNCRQKTLQILMDGCGAC